MKAVWVDRVNGFVLDPVLDNDCYKMGHMGNSLLLLLNNSRVPWFILVPEVGVSEFYELEQRAQHDLLASINSLSVFVKNEFNCDKLNVATIGNIVSQLHVHVIGRQQNDYCWPGVVWGAEGSVPYEDSDVARIHSALEQRLDSDFLAGWRC